MKDVSQCLLSIIDEFEKYHSKIVSLEDANQCYDSNLKNMKSNRQKLLQSKRESILALKEKEEETESFLIEYEKLEGRNKYAQMVIEELREENANMNLERLKLKEENSAEAETLKKVRQELDVLKHKEESKPQDLKQLSQTLENLKTKLLISEQNLANLQNVNSENIELKKRQEFLVQEKLRQSSQEQFLKKQYSKLQNEKDRANDKIKHIEYEYASLSKLYQKAIHENGLLKKKAEDLILEKYEKMYETKHLFGVDVDSIRGQNNYTDIDALIDGIGLKPPAPIKALA